jgi:3-deoxy-manno-octulosonate cytidylyltransferase (CMP-KDO synthetase)
LRELAGKAMLQHVWERAMESNAAEVVIATDDQRIADAAMKFCADVCMTASNHQSVSERIGEVCRHRDWSDNDVVVNLQGDEPGMPASLINQCAALLDDDTVDIGTLASALLSVDDLQNPNVVKVLLDASDNAIVFSRSAIPFARTRDMSKLAGDTALHHHGIYSYRVGVLFRMLAEAAPAIERCEKLEQLRALYLGMTIRVGRPGTRPGPGIDTEDDLLRAERQLTGGRSQVAAR